MIYIFYPCKFLRKNFCPFRPNYQMIWQICPLCHVVINVTFPAVREREENKLWLGHGCWPGLFMWLLCDCCVIVVWLLQWLQDIKEESGRHHARHEHSRRNRQKLKNSWARKTLSKLMCTVAYDLSKTVNCAVLFQYSRSNVFHTPLETIYCLLG